MNRDFVEMLSALSDAEAEYLIVGAHALAVHGHPRATGDLDLWVRATPENAERVWKALQAFGAPLSDLSPEDFTSPDLVIQLGFAPNRIDILTGISGVSFDTAWSNRISASIADIEVPVIGREEFIRNKQAVGRPRDLADVADLET